MKEHVLVLIKPDGMARRIQGEVLSKFIASGLQLVAAQMLRVDRALAEEHYKQLKNQEFYPRLIDLLLGKFHGSADVLAFVFSGENAVFQARQIAGATNPEEAAPGTVRGSFGRITSNGRYENVVHVSSDSKEAEREIKLWFSPEQILEDIYSTKINDVHDNKKEWS